MALAVTGLTLPLLSPLLLLLLKPQAHPSVSLHRSNQLLASPLMSQLAAVLAPEGNEGARAGGAITGRIPKPVGGAAATCNPL